MTPKDTKQFFLICIIYSEYAEKKAKFKYTDEPSKILDKFKQYQKWWLKTMSGI